MNAQPQRIQEIKRRSTTNKNNYSTGISIKKQATMYLVHFVPAFWLFWLTFVSVQHNQLNSDGCFGAALTQRRHASATTTTTTTTTTLALPLAQDAGRSQMNSGAPTLAGYKMTAEAAADAPLAAAPTTGSNTVTATTAAAVATDNGNAAMKTTSKTITTFKTTATTIRTPTHNTSTPTVATTTAAGKQINAKHLKLSRNVTDAQSFAYDFKENVARLFANDAPFSRQSTASSAPAAAAQHSNERRHIVPEKLQYTAEINVKQGRLMGIVRNFHASTGLRDVDQYLGLPYAEAPVGSRRFMPPGAPLPWQGLKIARHLPPVCPQQLPDISIQGSAKMSRGRFKHLTRLLPYLKNENEDCLYLNVYVPRQDAAAGPDRARPPYPVLVYVHGESFEWNSGNPYDGSVLASYGEAIVVTINYRLGVLGFLKPSIDENTVANFGLLDQIAALHWIKENIASFGGNKDSVTLMGHSTGAACVNYLMISPVASGLFHRAILMSGSAMSDWAATNHSLQLTMQIAHGLNCPLNDDNEEMLSCLRQKRYQDILKIPTSLPQFSTSLGPIVDGHVIPNQPYRVMGQYTEHFSRYDLLFGITESESYHTLGPAALDEGLRENERDNLLRFYMQTRFDVRPDLALAATLKKYEDMYNNPIKATNLEHRDVVLDILSDARVVGPLMQTGLFHADVNRRNYMYVFGHNSAAGPHASLPHSITGEELAFVFGAPLAPAGPFASSNYSAQEKLLAEAVMAYWTNFAKTGNPKAPWKGNFINLHALEWDRYDLDWPEFNKRSQAYMNIGIPPSIGYKYRQIYMNFWNKELPDELNQIASLQRQPFLHAQPYPGAQLPRGGTTPLAYPARRTGSEVITGHMSKFGTRDNGAEDPVRTLKLLLQEPYAYGVPMQVETAENMYNAPPTFGVAKQADDELFGVNTLPSNALPAGVSAVGSYGGISGGSAIYGVSKSEQAEEGSGGSGSGAGNLDDGNKEEVAKSEATIQLLIGLIVVFIVLNVVIYSTFLLQKKKKATTMKRKLGGILSYDGATDDELKRSKQNDGDDSYIMDIVRKSNTYEAVKTERSPINGYKMARQLSSSTVDTHTKVCAWMSAAAAHASAEPNKEQGSPKTSKKSSSPTFSSLHSSSAGGGGSFRKPPYKVNVAVDATPQARGSSVLCQEPIEVLKMKADGRNIIICQEVEVDDQELLTPQNSLDASRYSLARQHSTATEACEAELPPQEQQQQHQLSAAPKHAHSHSDPVDLLYYSQLCAADETVTSFMQAHALPPDINVTSRDDDAAAAGAPDVSALTPAQQLLLIKSRNYPKVLPTSGTAATTAARAGDSPPMTLDLRTTNKRNSLPPNSFLPYFTSGRQLPPQPPPRTVSTLGRKPSLGRRNSNNITTSPLMLAQDCAEEEEEPPQITQNTLIVGPIVPKQRTGGGSLDANYSTLRRNEATSKAAAIEAAATSLNEAATIHADSTDGSNAADRKVLQRPPPTPTPAPAPAATTLLMGALSGSFQTFESRPASVGKSADIGDAHTPHTHHTEKVYAVAPTTLTATPTAIMPAASARLSPTNLSALTPSTATTNTSASASGLITTLPAAAAAGGGEQEIVVAGAPAGGGAGGGKCDIYAQPAKFAIKPNVTASKSGIPRIMAAATMQPAAQTTHAAAIVGHQTALAAGATTSATTASCSHASAMIAGNQVSAEITTTTTTTATAASTSVSATMATAATATGSRIPQLHRNLCAQAPQQQQKQQPTMPNRDKSNANVATTTTTTTSDGTSTIAATTTTALTTLTTPTVTKLTTGNPTISAIAADAVTAARETTAIGLRDSAISSASTSSSSSTASSASASASLASASAASSTGDSYSTSSSSSTSSSTGTVRTELQQK